MIEMQVVYIIHAEEDIPFLKEHIFRLLPSNGYEYWLNSDMLGRSEGQDIPRIMKDFQAILFIISPHILQSEKYHDQIKWILTSRLQPIIIQIANLTSQEKSQLPEQLWNRPIVSYHLQSPYEADRLLVNLLPPMSHNRSSLYKPVAEKIEWNEEIFSKALDEVTNRHDHAGTVLLVDTFIAHLRERPYSYAGSHASNDLFELRQARKFALMRLYAEGVIESGTISDRVRRLYAQALIETKDYEVAISVLLSLVNNFDTSKKELYEAKGLLGRVHKQLYVNNPEGPGARDILRTAISEYLSVYSDDNSNFWHGVNAASCILRANRDNITDISKNVAEEIALKVLEDLESLSKAGNLAVWDCASRVEALLALNDYQKATDALEIYIAHPDMRAFEVSSTYRQFHELLQLDKDKDDTGREILNRLRDTMERHRAVDVDSEYQEMEDDKLKQLVIRVTDPDWSPDENSSFQLETRLGNIVTGLGTNETVRVLLEDNAVISVDESRPVGETESEESLPFIGIAQAYANQRGSFREEGENVLIAIIDDGIDILHQAFQDTSGGTRILGVWDQTSQYGSAPPGFSYGMFHDYDNISEFLKNGNTPANLGRHVGGHGTHVASIAAGRPAGTFAGGVAPQAKLLIVRSSAEQSIGYSKSHIDALKFIDSFASQLDLPVVVNVSQGMNAGAHDGKSALEAAFDSFTSSGRKAGRVIVKSAGNERDKSGHAKLTLQSHSLESLTLRRFAGAHYHERIEFWWSSADEIDFRLINEIGQTTDWVGINNNDEQGVFSSGSFYHLTFVKHHVDNGDSHFLVKIGSILENAAIGDWQIEIRSANIKDKGDIHCWIERNNGTASSFLNHTDEEITLSIPGTAQSVITVGATNSSYPIRVGEFSSYGPTRLGQKKPLVCAPGVKIQAANGGTSDGVIRKSGTSMAAPHVTGAIGLLLSRAEKNGKKLNANQIAAALSQKTQHYNGKWDRGQGYGIINVPGLLAAFE